MSDFFPLPYVIALYVGVALYALLAMVLMGFLYQKVKSHHLAKARQQDDDGPSTTTTTPCYRDLSVWVLSGFIIDLLMIAGFELLPQAIFKDHPPLWVANAVGVEDCLYHILVCLLIVEWYLWVSQSRKLREERCSNKFIFFVLFLLILGTLAFLAFTIWTMVNPLPNSSKDLSSIERTQVIGLAAGFSLEILFGISLGLLSRELFKKKYRVEGGGCVALALYAVFAAVSHLMGILAVFVPRLALYNFSATVWCVVTVVFFGLQWLALLGSLKTLVGPSISTLLERNNSSNDDPERQRIVDKNNTTISLDQPLSVGGHQYVNNNYDGINN